MAINGYTENGFTLIELLITVVIIGILAAIGLPAYTTYLARSQVTESFNLMSQTKTIVRDIYYQDGSLININNGYLNIPLASDIQGKYVEKITVTNGLITTQMKSTTSSGIASTEIVFSPVTAGASVKWICRSGSSNPMPTTYLPKVCR